MKKRRANKANCSRCGKKLIDKNYKTCLRCREYAQSKVVITKKIYMSSFICEHCQKEILDSRNGYITSCEHYPLIEKSKEELKKLREQKYQANYYKKQLVKEGKIII